MNIMEEALMCPLCYIYSNDDYVVAAHMVAVSASSSSQLKRIALKIDKMYGKLR